MITTDPFHIVSAMIEEIIRLEDADALGDVVPDPEYGYTSDNVFGFFDCDVAAMHVHVMATGEEAIWFQLKDGRIVSPDRQVCGIH